MSPKILIVLTSFGEIPGAGPTGWYLPEFAHPHEVLHKKAALVIASPNGGKAPLDPNSVKMFESDPVAKNFLDTQESLWTNTEKLADMLGRVDEFDAIFYVGGHGPMFDLTTDKTSIQLIESFAAKRKPVTAVCHGPCVFLNTKNASGESLIAGAQVTGFSNAEEDAVKLSAAMPFMLETELQRVSGKYCKAERDWGVKVVKSKTNGYGGVIITGQNPASAGAVAEAILDALG
ncbi:ThiJ/PfpI family protein [Penicillium malachiteum]|nr:ThiJ/PfpI family protein [Penicillium malachiteum]